MSRLTRTPKILPAALATALLAGCGLKGDLFLPTAPEPAEPVVTPAPADDEAAADETPDDEENGG